MSSNGSILPPRSSFGACVGMAQHHSAMPTSVICWLNGGISVHRSTVYRWFIEYAPVLRKKLKKYQFIRAVSSWQLDETYVKVNGKWFYLYRAIDKYGETLDIYFSPKRHRHAAYEFLKRVLKPYPAERQPKTLNTDKHAYW